MKEYLSSAAIGEQNRAEMELALEIAREALVSKGAATGVGVFFVKDGVVVACTFSAAQGLGKPITLEGANGGQVGFTEDGMKVEWQPSEEVEGELWPMPMRRSDDEISDAVEEYFDKVWWNRHQNWLFKIEQGLESSNHPSYKKAREAALKIEAKYGLENLGWDDFEWGMVNGKLSALRWVLGDEWDMLDT